VQSEAQGILRQAKLLKQEKDQRFPGVEKEGRINGWSTRGFSGQ